MLQMKFLYSIWTEHQNEIKVHSSQMLIQRAKSLFQVWKYGWGRVHKRIKIPKPLKIGLGSIKLKVTAFTLPQCKGWQLMETLAAELFQEEFSCVCHFYLV